MSLSVLNIMKSCIWLHYNSNGRNYAFWMFIYWNGSTFTEYNFQKLWKDIQLSPNSIPPATHFPFSFPDVVMVSQLLMYLSIQFMHILWIMYLPHVLLFYIQMVAHYTHYPALCFFHLIMYVGDHPTSLHKWCPSFLYIFYFCLPRSLLY